MRVSVVLYGTLNVSGYYEEFLPLQLERNRTKSSGRRIFQGFVKPGESPIETNNREFLDRNFET